jgi:hypothetical protein
VCKFIKRRQKKKLSESQTQKKEEGGEEGKQSKKMSPECGVIPTRLGDISVGYECTWLVGWLGAVNRARGVCFFFRVCVDRSDVLFDLSAADHRRLCTYRKVRGTNQMLIYVDPSSTTTRCGLRVHEP